MNKPLLIIMLLAAVGTASASEESLLKASFSAQEAATTYYHQGWDDLDEANTWQYNGISDKTWMLTEAPTLSGTKPFTVIDPESKYSMSIRYAEVGQQDETATSPSLEIRPNSQVEYWACFSGVWLVFADLKFYVNDLTTGESHQLISTFLWAQENEFTGPNWVRFNFDLAQYAGHTCTFSFNYKGSYGDDLSIDGFRLTQQDRSDDAVIRITEGESIHFADLSEGKPDTWAWSFEGGTPATSNEQNPVVTYAEAGTYAVSLTVSRGGESSTSVHEQYVIVSAEAPRAHIGIPEGAYLSPWAAAYVPVGVPLTYRDLSTGRPTQWLWNFVGADIAESCDQHPVVTYTQPGTYSLELTVSNAAGEDHDFLLNAIQAGGAQDVWNIAPEESGEVNEVALGWYGSYAGTNWLGMRSFAEHFDKPLVTATIDTLTLYFASVRTETPSAPITVCLCLADDEGKPGEPLGSVSLPVSQLVYDDEYVVPTYFVLPEPVTVNSEFFVTISGFPQGDIDDVSLLCVYRGTEAKSTTWHELEDEDERYNPLGTYSWVQNVDEGISMALTAHLEYQDDSADIRMPAITTPQGIRYDLQGRRTERQKGLIIADGKVKLSR